MAYVDTADSGSQDGYPPFPPRRAQIQAGDQYPDVGGARPAPLPGFLPGEGDPSGRIDKGIQPPKQAPAPQRPSGGSINDPGYLDQMLSYYGQQPGVNPSVTNDPNYWRQAVGSGRFKGDENYLIQRFFQAEGAPEGGGSGNSALDAFLQAQMADKKQTADQRQGILSRLMGLADQYSKPVDANSPGIKESADAFGAQTDRAQQMSREMMAERAHAQGVPTGAFDAALGNSLTQAGMAKASNVSGLISTQLNQQRAQLSDVLKQSSGLLSDQDQADIQNKIANIDAQLKKEGLNLQGRSLDIQELLGNKNLDQQNNQFYDKFASDNAKDLNNEDIVALLRSLGLI